MNQDGAGPFNIDSKMELWLLRLQSSACASLPPIRISCAPQGGTMRAQTMVIGLMQAAMLVACDRPKNTAEPADSRRDVQPSNKSSRPVALGEMGASAVSQREASAQSPAPDQ